MRLLCAWTLVFLLCVSRAGAAPLKLTMTIDELRSGKAVLSGDIDSLFGTNGQLNMTATLGDGSATKHWSLELTVIRMIGSTFPYNITNIVGRHISDPPPHPGEASPGPGFGPYAFNNLIGAGGVDPPLTLDDSKGHDGHDDKLHIDLIDLNGAAAGVLGGVDREVRMNFTFTHTPEPAGAALLLAGSLWISRWVRFKR